MVFLRGGISPVLFNIMINDMFSILGEHIISALYADDGATWVRGRYEEYVTEKIRKVMGV